LRFFEFAACVWDKRAQQLFDDGVPSSAENDGFGEPVGERLFVNDSPEVTEGRSSYAKRQAGVFRSMGQRCSNAWAGIDEYVSDFGSTFDDDYEAGSGIVTDTPASSSFD
jgi:hypothetical protein